MRILYLDIDTLRPDHMGCYGYKRNTTPNLDKVAADGVVFENYYCSDAPCLPSRAALLSGRFGIHTGIVGHGGTAADRRLVGLERDFQDQTERDNLWYIMKRAGMHTASISTFPERHSAWWFTAGLNEWHNVNGGGMESGEEVLPTALDWLKRNKEMDNWFLHLHIWDPHTPYRAPLEFGNPFENEPLCYDWITEEIFAKHYQKAGPHTARDLSGISDHINPKYPRHPGSLNNLAEVKNFIDQYDTGIKYADHLLGQVFDMLRTQGIYEDTAIIISSDHGENMGELGLYAEHGTADNITCKIPMIIKWPGGKVGRDKGLRYNLDLCPTLAELINSPVNGNWDGKSYAGLVDGNGTFSDGRKFLVLSQQAHVCQRAVRFGDWIYIRTIHDGFQDFDEEMLFDVTNDPHEQFDLKHERPDVCAMGAKLILDWTEEMMKTSKSEIDPMWTVMSQGGPHHADARWMHLYMKRLDETNRSEAARRLEKKHKRT
ncbi:MAG: sulfatase [Defluviitaleaceae bacterium]|nr:sulfatase [Defluviitaleaceae bacterium]